MKMLLVLEAYNGGLIFPLLLLPLVIKSENKNKKINPVYIDILFHVPFKVRDDT